LTHNTGTILVVEDDNALRHYVECALKPLGLPVHAVASGLEALKWLKQESDSVRLLILDLVLPSLNGLELLALLRQDPATRQLAVLVTTGTMLSPRQFDDDRQVSVLRKPYDERQLIVAVESMLAGYVVRA
jgi:two-component system cell cycle sensor histidine kinase/response regulator CckA